MRSWESSQSDTDLFLVLRGGPGCGESYLWTVIIPVPWSQSHPGSPQTQTSFWTQWGGCLCLEKWHSLLFVWNIIHVEIETSWLWKKTDMCVTTATLLLNLSPVWSWLDSIPLFLALPQPSEDISLFPLTVSLPIALDSCVFFVWFSSHRVLPLADSSHLLAAGPSCLLSPLESREALSEVSRPELSLLSSEMIFEMSYVRSFNCRPLDLDTGCFSLMIESNFEARFATVWGRIAIDIRIPGFVFPLAPTQQPFRSL